MSTEPAHFVTSVVQKYRVHALQAGSGEPVVLLHGLSGSARWWRYTLPVLSQHFLACAPDLVGFGRSRGRVRQPDIPAMARIVVAWLDALSLERVHLIGHSMGGQIAIHIAAKHAERVGNLVLVSAAGIPRPRTLVEAARFLAEIIPPRAWGVPSFLPRVALDSVRAGPSVLLRATAHLLRDDVRPLLPRIGAPTLLIWGALDALTPLRDGEHMAAHIPGARLVTLADAAHVPMVDRPQLFNDLVLQHLGARG